MLAVVEQHRQAAAQVLLSLVHSLADVAVEFLETLLVVVQLHLWPVTLVTLFPDSSVIRLAKA